jgi:hypothetical protein
LVPFPQHEARAAGQLVALMECGVFDDELEELTAFNTDNDDDDDESRGASSGASFWEQIFSDTAPHSGNKYLATLREYSAFVNLAKAWSSKHLERTSTMIRPISSFREVDFATTCHKRLSRALTIQHPSSLRTTEPLARRDTSVPI